MLCTCDNNYKSLQVERKEKLTASLFVQSFIRMKYLCFSHQNEINFLQEADFSVLIKKFLPD
jgi:hypothetical protein